MCGVVGSYARRDVGIDIYEALTILQHRGQESAGIVTVDNGRVNKRRALGLVNSVFADHHMQRLKGNIGIGHVRYPTAGSSGVAYVQPFYVNSPYGISLAHNGNLINADQLREGIIDNDKRHLNTDSDSEVLINVLAHELQHIGGLKLTPNDIFKALENLFQRCKGAYSCVGIIVNQGLIGFRDMHGIRPLVLGSRKAKTGYDEYMLASESSVFSVLGYKFIRDIAPGEVVFIDTKGKLHSKICVKQARLTPCLFEHVYFSRPDSVMDGIHLYKTRLRQGEKLAKKIISLRPDNDIDVVIPVPDTSRVASQGLAEALNLKLREGLMKNRFIGRTFIIPGQKKRQKSVRQKLNVIELEVRNKIVLLVDDSIVRGTTCKEIVDMVRAAGAKKVYFASAAPRVCYPNVYGIDMPVADELIAYGKTNEQVAEQLGVDWLVYQDLDDLIECSREGNPSITEYECSVFDGNYITGGVNKEYLEKLKNRRSDAAQRKTVTADGYLTDDEENDS